MSSTLLERTSSWRSAWMMSTKRSSSGRRTRIARFTAGPFGARVIAARRDGVIDLGTGLSAVVAGSRAVRSSGEGEGGTGVLSSAGRRGGGGLRDALLMRLRITSRPDSASATGYLHVFGHGRELFGSRSDLHPGVRLKDQR